MKDCHRKALRVSEASWFDRRRITLHLLLVSFGLFLWSCGEGGAALTASGNATGGAAGDGVTYPVVGGGGGSAENRFGGLAAGGAEASAGAGGGGSNWAVAGAGAGAAEARPRGISLVDVTQQRYYLLPQRAGEPRGFAVYTYVLFGADVATSTSTGIEATRYQALLDAIAASVHSLQASGLAAPKSRTNLFCIPSKSSGSKPSLANYNFVLASDLLVFARGTLPKSDNFWAKLGNPGPILISTVQQTLESTAPGQPILFADLSRANPSAMDEVVAAYTLKLQQAPPKGPEVFAPIRLALLSLILDANDNVPGVKKAYADVIPSGS